MNSLDEKYFSTSAPTSHPSDSSGASDCSCQIRSKISRNENNLKNLDLKITLELVDFKKRLDDIRNILESAGPSSSEPTPEAPAPSSPEENPLLPLPSRIPPSSTPSRPVTESNKNDEETDDENPTSESDFDTGKSEYEFSDVDHLN